MAFEKLAVEIKTRLGWLANFAQILGSRVQSDRYVWSNGRYLIVHFDLITSDPPGVNRSGVYRAMADLVVKNGGTRVGETVFVVPLLATETSELCGARLWNAIQGTTKDKLIEGDSFYVHFAPDAKNLLGGIAEVVESGNTSLGIANEASI